MELIDGDRLGDLFREFRIGIEIRQRTEEDVLVNPGFFDEYQSSTHQEKCARRIAPGAAQSAATISPSSAYEQTHRDKPVTSPTVSDHRAGSSHREARRAKTASALFMP